MTNSQQHTMKAPNSGDTPASPGGDSPEPQPLVGFMDNDELDQLVGFVNDAIEGMQALPDEGMRKRVFDMLAGVDALHREGLRRLVRLFDTGVLEKVITDPAIHILMELYDLLPPAGTAGSDNADRSVHANSADNAESAADNTAPSGQAGSKVTGLSASRFKPFPDIPIRTEPLDRSPPRFPHWVPAGKLDQYAAGTASYVRVENQKLLVCRVKKELFVVDASCVQDSKLMQDATLDAFTLCCPHHRGCLYDVRNGARIGAGDYLECYQVTVNENERVMVGMDMGFEPNLPSF